MTYASARLTSSAARSFTMGSMVSWMKLIRECSWVEGWKRVVSGKRVRKRTEVKYQGVQSVGRSRIFGALLEVVGRRVASQRAASLALPVGSTGVDAGNGGRRGYLSKLHFKRSKCIVYPTVGLL